MRGFVRAFFYAVIDFATPASLDDAVLIQQELRRRVRIDTNDVGMLRTIAGVDASYDVANNLTRAFIVVLNYADLSVIARAKAVVPTAFPYIPGFLSFREIPAILEALKQLPERPDLFMVDGQGIAHPRRMGIASHLGVLLDHPAIGVAKSRLCGWHTEPGPRKGDHTPLIHEKHQIATVLRSKDNVKPLFVSPGHRIDQTTALSITLRCLTRYRLPEPTRLADKWSKEKGQDDDHPAPQLSLF